MSSEIQQPESAASFFASPEAAVPIIADLLRENDFKTLAAYYDLTGSSIDHAELLSGDFFIRKERPEMAHPAGFWRYKHPFAPGFEYNNTSPGPGKSVYIIQVSIEIDQGEGAPAQVGKNAFYMVQSTKGWQVLPGTVKEAGASAIITAPEPMPKPSWMK